MRCGRPSDGHGKSFGLMGQERRTCTNYVSLPKQTFTPIVRNANCLPHNLYVITSPSSILKHPFVPLSMSVNALPNWKYKWIYQLSETFVICPDYLVSWTRNTILTLLRNHVLITLKNKTFPHASCSTINTRHNQATRLQTLKVTWLMWRHRPCEALRNSSQNDADD
jgi:hypothetical protein